MVQSGLIHPASGAGEDPGPSNGETVGTHPHLLHQGDVFGVAMVLVTGLITVRPVEYSPRFPAEGIPDGIRPAFLPGGPLHLEGGCGRPPGEIRRECKPTRLVHAHTSSLTVPALLSSLYLEPEGRSVSTMESMRRLHQRSIDLAAYCPTEQASESQISIPFARRSGRLCCPGKDMHRNQRTWRTPC